MGCNTCNSCFNPISALTEGNTLLWICAACVILYLLKNSGCGCGEEDSCGC
jgi:hypothetical protein